MASGIGTRAPKETRQLLLDAAKYLNHHYGGFDIKPGFDVTQWPQTDHPGWAAGSSQDWGVDLYSDQLKEQLKALGGNRTFNPGVQDWSVRTMLHELAHRVGPWDYKGDNVNLEEGLAEQFGADAMPDYVHDKLNYKDPVYSTPTAYVPRVNRVRRMSFNAALLQDPNAAQNYGLADSEAAKLFRARLLTMDYPHRRAVINRQIG